jgi:hypothetical protein
MHLPLCQQERQCNASLFNFDQSFYLYFVLKNGEEQGQLAAGGASQATIHNRK